MQTLPAVPGPAGADGTLAMWDVATRVLEAQAGASAARAGARWERMLGNPALLEELRDYFTYAQVCVSVWWGAGLACCWFQHPCSRMPCLYVIRPELVIAAMSWCDGG